MKKASWYFNVHLTKTEKQKNLMLNTNLSRQSLSTFTNIYDMSVTVFRHLCRSLRHMHMSMHRI